MSSPEHIGYGSGTAVPGAENVARDDLTSWLVRASSKVLEQIMNGENLAAELDDLAVSFQESGDAEQLISQSTGVVALVGLYHVQEGRLKAKDVLEAAPGIILDTAADRELEGTFSDRLAEAAARFCLDFANPDEITYPAANTPTIPQPKAKEFRLEREIAILQSQQAREQDQQRAFTALFEEYSPRLLWHITNIMGSRFAAEDVLQDTFLMVALHIDADDFEYRGEAAFQSWIYTIAHRKTLNAIRPGSYHARSRSHVPLGEDGEDIFGLITTRWKDRTDVIAEQRENIRELQEILDGLLPHEREAIILQREGWSYEAIGNLQDRTAPAVRSLLVRAREKIQKRVNAKHGRPQPEDDKKAAPANGSSGR